MLIFIQIAAYRDNLLSSTLKDLLEKAKNPENLHISICHQYHDEDSYNNDLYDFRNDSRFNFIDIPYYESRGLCWARNLIQQQYNGEDYTLQIDSHMRFIFNWDIILIDMLMQLQKKGHPKPILTTYPPHFEPDKFEYKETAPNQIIFREFDKHGIYPIGWPAEIQEWKSLIAPIPARFLAGGFAFSIGSFCQEIPDDPNLYFMGEEINLAMRAFTYGYDLFHPNINICWHYYSRPKSPKHWEDHSFTEGTEILALNRLKRFFASEEDKSYYNWGIYGCGKVRSIKDYEIYSGVQFSKRKVQDYTLKNLPPPNPQIYHSKEDWIKSFCCHVNNVLHIPNDIIIKDNYNYAKLVFLANKQVVYKLLLTASEIDEIFEFKVNYCNINLKFSCEFLPDTWILSLHKESSGWGKKIKGRMPYFVAGLGNFSIKKCHIL